MSESDCMKKMEQKFIETICIKDGRVLNLRYHNERMNRTRKIHWGETVGELFLEDFIKTEPSHSYTRCRVVYGEDIEEIAYYPYQVRPVHSLKLVVDDEADYRYKSADRSLLNRLFAERDTADDVLIVRKGQLTDTSIANIALFDGKEWFTPTNPLLKGTRRQSLLDEGQLKERDINVDTLSAYQKIRLFNAMIPFGEVELVLDHTTIR